MFLGERVTDEGQQTLCGKCSYCHRADHMSSKESPLDETRESDLDTAAPSQSSFSSFFTVTSKPALRTANHLGSESFIVRSPLLQDKSPSASWRR